MQKKENFLPFFIVFFGLSLLLILIGRSGIVYSLTGITNKSTEGLRRGGVEIFSLKRFENKRINDLTSENLKLQKEVADKNNLILENKALRAQFENISLRPSSLIPAKVISYPGFIPGISLPQYLIIDKGRADGVSPGSTAVFENYLVGKVVDADDNSSKVELVFSKKSSFTAKVADSNISGIIKGKGTDEMVLDNVLLSENLKKDSLILTKGDLYPPDLLVGKIISIEKKSEEIFQRAEIRSPLDFKNLDFVFILK